MGDAAAARHVDQARHRRPAPTPSDPTRPSARRPSVYPSARRPSTATRAAVGGARVDAPRPRATAAQASVRHSVTLDKLDDPLVPTAGYAVKASTEVAGLWATYASASTRSPRLPSCRPARRAPLARPHQRRLLVPMGKRGSWRDDEPSASFVCDRFFLGGANSFRNPARTASGLATAMPPEHPAAHATGASSRDALGGETMSVATVALGAPLAGAKLRENSVRAQLFSSFGGLHALSELRGDTGSTADVIGTLPRRSCLRWRRSRLPTRFAARRPPTAAAPHAARFAPGLASGSASRTCSNGKRRHVQRTRALACAWAAAVAHPARRMPSSSGWQIGIRSVVWSRACRG